MTTATSGVRIQLEGHLEAVEAHIARLREAAGTLGHSSWVDDPRWLEVLSSEAAESVRLVESRAGDGGLVDSTLAELAAAQKKVRSATCERLVSLHVSFPRDASAIELLRLLKVHRPMHSLAVRARRLAKGPDLAALITGSFGGFAVWLLLMPLMIHMNEASESGAVLLMAVLVVCVGLGLRVSLRAAKAGHLQLTESGLRLATGGKPMLVPIEGLEVAVSRSGAGFLVQVRSAGEVSELDTATEPVVLIEQLRERGARIHSERFAPG